MADADGNPPSSSLPATAPSSSSSPLDTDPHTPFPHQQSTMPRAALTPNNGDGFTMFRSDLSAALPILSTSGAPALPAPPPPPPSTPSLRDVSIGNYISFKVTTSGTNLSKWQQIITFLLTMYNALDHVTEGAAPAAPDDAWRADDIHISLWFMATLADDLLRLVQDPAGRAATTWTRLHNFFFANRSSRYVYLSKVFRNTPRGDMGIAVYASHLQSIADDLANIGYPVADHDLTMQFLDGLGGKYLLQSEMIQSTVPLPSFADACSRLLLAELSIDKRQREESSQALVAHEQRPQDRGGRGPSSGGGRGSSGGGRGGGFSGPIPGVSPHYRGKNPIPGYVPHGGNNGGQSSQTGGGAPGSRRRGGGGHGSNPYGGAGGSSQQPWMGYFAPWGAPFPPARFPWVPPNSAGVLGPRPGAPSQAYFSGNGAPAPPQYSAPTPQYAAPAPPPYAAPPHTLDHAALLHQAVSNSSAGSYPAHQPEWIMDSGASSHVTGPNYQDYSSSLQ